MRSSVPRNRETDSPSSGIAVTNGSINVRKAQGKIGNLEALLDDQLPRRGGRNDDLGISQRASGNDAGRAGSIDNDGGLIVAGASSGGWPTKNAHQEKSKGPGDAIVAKLSSSTGAGSKP